MFCRQWICNYTEIKKKRCKLCWWYAGRKAQNLRVRKYTCLHLGVIIQRSKVKIINISDMWGLSPLPCRSHPHTHAHTHGFLPVCSSDHSSPVPLSTRKVLLCLDRLSCSLAATNTHKHARKDKYTPAHCILHLLHLWYFHMISAEQACR